MESVKQFFDRLAAEWDCFQKQADFEVVDRVLRRIGLSSSDRVLDVGAGTGVLVPFLLRHGCKSIQAIDISQGMVDQYRRKHPDGEVICGNYEDSGLFEREAFTKVIIFNTFPHFARPEAIFRNAHLNLSPGGQLVVFHSMTRDRLNLKHREVGGVVGNHMLISDDEFRAGLETAGFEAIVIEDESHFFASAIKRAWVYIRSCRLLLVFVVMWLLFVLRMRVLVRAMLTGRMLVLVPLVWAVFMVMSVFVAMRMAVLMSVLMAMGHLAVLVRMFVVVVMRVLVLVTVWVLSFHV
jgi:SAM-dependent methyltransferase